MERPIATAAKNRQRVRELEVVEVSQHDHVRPRVGRQEFVDEGPHHVRLRAALRLREARWWLEAAEQRVVAALRLPMVGDDEQFPATGPELARERVAPP